VIAAALAVRLGEVRWDKPTVFDLSYLPPIIRYPAYAGVVLLATWVVLWLTGKWKRLREKMRFGLEPALGGERRYLHAFAVYLGFTVLGARIGFRLVPNLWADMAWLGEVAYYGAPVFALAWPRLRGVRWRTIRKDLGLHRGRGLWVELGMGVLGFCVLWPLFSAAFCASRWAFGGDWVGFGGADVPGTEMPKVPWTAAALHLGSLLVWAPLVEETLFRGSLFRGLRGVAKWAVSGVVVALLSAMMHTPWDMWPVHFVTGFGSVFLREWRGSLIAPMVAHGLHNSVSAYYFVMLWYSW
jgi:membrane protease YdiL (CAAX protease family)